MENPALVAFAHTVEAALMVMAPLRAVDGVQVLPYVVEQVEIDADVTGVVVCVVVVVTVADCGNE